MSTEVPQGAANEKKDAASVFEQNPEKSAEAVDVLDAGFEDVDKTKALRKMDFHLMPILAVLYLLSFMDRGQFLYGRHRDLALLFPVF